MSVYSYPIHFTSLFHPAIRPFPVPVRPVVVRFGHMFVGGYFISQFCDVDQAGIGSGIEGFDAGEQGQGRRLDGVGCAVDRVGTGCIKIETHAFYLFTDQTTSRN